MSDADTEAVLGDLLKELGVEGVTLWQIRCFASVLHNKKNWDGRGLHPNNWLESDLRGESAVRVDATEEAVRRDAWQRLFLGEWPVPVGVDVARSNDATVVALVQGGEVTRIVNVGTGVACDHHPNTDCVRCR